MNVISVVLVLGAFSSPAHARMDDDSQYNLFENSRHSAMDVYVDDKDLDFNCSAQCTSPEESSNDSSIAQVCSEYKSLNSCIKAGCDWSCQ